MIVAAVELSGDALAAEAAGGLDRVRADEWDALAAPGSAPLRHGYLSAWETAELRGLRSSPVVARAPGSGELLAACPGYFYELDVARRPRSSPAVTAIRRRWPSFLFSRVYELRSAAPLTNPFLVVEPRRRARATAALIRAAAEAARDGGRGPRRRPELQRPRTPGRGGARAPRLRAGRHAADAVVELRHDCFEEYLAAMRARYRRRARQALERSAALVPETLTEARSIAAGRSIAARGRATSATGDDG